MEEARGGTEGDFGGNYPSLKAAANKYSTVFWLPMYLTSP